MELIPNYFTKLALLLCCTAFLKMATVLSFLRYGLGLGDIIFGVVALTAAVAFAFVVPTAPLQSPQAAASSFLEQAELQRTFLERNADPEVITTINAIRTKLVTQAQPPVSVADQSVPQSEPGSPVAIQSILASFVLAELTDAFQLGLLILIPFVVIDLIVVNVLAVLGVTQISAVLLSLPLKVAVFVGAGGWQLLVEKLLNGYG